MKAMDRKREGKSKIDVVTRCANLVLTGATLLLLIVAYFNYNKFVQYVELMQQSIASQAESVRLQTQDLHLTHKPVVFISKSFLPEGKDQNNPFSHMFIITNSGKLPARHTNVLISMDIVDKNQNFIVNFTQNFILLKDANIYPGADLILWIPESIKLGSEIAKAQVVFTVEYRGEDGQTNKEQLKYLFSKDTSYNWVFVGQGVDSFAEERAEGQKKYREMQERFKSGEWR